MEVLRIPLESMKVSGVWASDPQEAHPKDLQKEGNAKKLQNQYVHIPRKHEKAVLRNTMT